MSTARHIDSTNPERVRVMLATGRIRPKVVTKDYLRRLMDDCEIRFRKAVEADPDTAAVEDRRYGRARDLLEREIERYRQQGEG